ncbi:hypothetical protein HK097_002479, partial [Rhizophlyctis rosea]
MNVYAPYKREERCTYLEQLSSLIETILADEGLIVAGDFNDSLNILLDRHSNSTRPSTKLQDVNNESSTLLNAFAERNDL